MMKAKGHCPRNAVDKSIRKAREHTATMVSAAKLATPIGAAFAMCGTRMTCLEMITDENRRLHAQDDVSSVVSVVAQWNVNGLEICIPIL